MTTGTQKNPIFLVSFIISTNICPFDPRIVLIAIKTFLRFRMIFVYPFMDCRIRIAGFFPSAVFVVYTEFESAFPRTKFFSSHWNAIPTSKAHNASVFTSFRPTKF